MADNPFVGLLGEFRTAAATLDARCFCVGVWWDFRPEFINPKRKILGCCQLPYLADGEVSYSEFVLTVDVGRGLSGTRDCGLPFAGLASRAGAALLQCGELCRELAVHVPAYVSETAPWWVVLLWKLAWDGPFPELLSETGEPTGRVPPMSIIRPFHASIHAIEVCKLHTDSPCLPETPHPMIAELAGATLWRQESDGNLSGVDTSEKEAEIVAPAIEAEADRLEASVTTKSTKLRVKVHAETKVVDIDGTPYPLYGRDEKKERLVAFIQALIDAKGAPVSATDYGIRSRDVESQHDKITSLIGDDAKPGSGYQIPLEKLMA